jgi:hypothetical protein
MHTVHACVPVHACGCRRVIRGKWAACMHARELAQPRSGGRVMYHCAFHRCQVLRPSHPARQHPQRSPTATYATLGGLESPAAAPTASSAPLDQSLNPFKDLVKDKLFTCTMCGKCCTGEGEVRGLGEGFFTRSHLRGVHNAPITIPSPGTNAHTYGAWRVGARRSGSRTARRARSPRTSTSLRRPLRRNTRGGGPAWRASTC